MYHPYNQDSNKKSSLGGDSKYQSPNFQQRLAPNSAQKSEGKNDEIDFASLKSLKKRNEELLKSLGNDLYLDLTHQQKQGDNFTSPQPIKQTPQYSHERELKSTHITPTTEKKQNQSSGKKSSAQQQGGSAQSNKKQENQFQNTEGFLEYQSFEDYTNHMVKPIRRVDVKNKILELKALSSSMVQITEDNSLDNIDSILRKYVDLRNVEQIPLYKKIQEDGLDSVRERGRLTEPENYQSIRNPNDVIARLHMDKTLTKGREREQIELFLDSLGINASIFNKTSNNKENQDDIATVSDFQLKQQYQNTPERGKNSINDQQQVRFDTASGNKLNSKPPKLYSSDKGGNALSEQYQGIPKSAKDDPQVSGVLSNMQYFLSQNLKEVVEIKEMLSSKSAGQQNADNNSPIQNQGGNVQQLVQNIAKNGDLSNFAAEKGGFLTQDNALEKKMQEAQTERLVKKIATLNKKVESLEKENKQLKSSSQHISQALKAGQVSISNFVRQQINLYKTPHSEFGAKFGEYSMYAAVFQTTINLYSSLEDLEKPELQIFIQDIEQIYYLDIQNSLSFIIKISEKDSNQGEPTSIPSPKPLQSVSLFYILTIKDAVDLEQWSLIFFQLNARILTQNTALQNVSNSEFLYGFNQYVDKYLSSAPNKFDSNNKNFNSQKFRSPSGGGGGGRGSFAQQDGTFASNQYGNQLNSEERALKSTPNRKSQGNSQNRSTQQSQRGSTSQDGEDPIEQKLRMLGQNVGLGDIQNLAQNSKSDRNADYEEQKTFYSDNKQQPNSPQNQPNNFRSAQQGGSRQQQKQLQHQQQSQQQYQQQQQQRQEQEQYRQDNANYQEDFNQKNNQQRQQQQQQGGGGIALPQHEYSNAPYQQPQSPSQQQQQLSMLDQTQSTTTRKQEISPRQSQQPQSISHSPSQGLSRQNTGNSKRRETQRDTTLEKHQSQVRNGVTFKRFESGYFGKNKEVDCKLCLSDDLQKLLLRNPIKGKESSLPLSDIQAILFGDQSEFFAKKKNEDLKLCFSLKTNTKEKYHFRSPTENAMKQFVKSLEYLIQNKDKVVNNQ